MSAETKGRVTDGQQSIPWATSPLLIVQPCQPHNAHPSSALLHPLHRCTDILFHLYCFSLSCGVNLPHHFLTHRQLWLTSQLRKTTLSLFVLFFLNFPWQIEVACQKHGLIPLIFLHVVTAQAAIPSISSPFTVVPARWPELRSPAHSHTLQLQRIACRSP